MSDQSTNSLEEQLEEIDQSQQHTEVENPGEIPSDKINIRFLPNFGPQNAICTIEAERQWTIKDLKLLLVEYFFDDLGDLNDPQEEIRILHSQNSMANTTVLQDIVGGDLDADPVDFHLLVRNRNVATFVPSSRPQRAPSPSPSPPPSPPRQLPNISMNFSTTESAPSYSSALPPIDPPPYSLRYTGSTVPEEHSSQERTLPLQTDTSSVTEVPTETHPSTTNQELPETEHISEPPTHSYNTTRAPLLQNSTQSTLQETQSTSQATQSTPQATQSTPQATQNGTRGSMFTYTSSENQIMNHGTSSYDLITDSETGQEYLVDQLDTMTTVYRLKLHTLQGEQVTVSIPTSQLIINDTGDHQPYALLTKTAAARIQDLLGATIGNCEINIIDPTAHTDGRGVNQHFSNINRWYDWRRPAIFNGIRVFGYDFHNVSWSELPLFLHDRLGSLFHRFWSACFQLARNGALSRMCVLIAGLLKYTFSLFVLNLIYGISDYHPYVFLSLLVVGNIASILDETNLTRLIEILERDFTTIPGHRTILGSVQKLLAFKRRLAPILNLI